ncbi:MAG TPA: histidine kinase [Gaiellaceae bacterium]|nr:histidine kinase [Gaiellaceae bacterium]
MRFARPGDPPLRLAMRFAWLVVLAAVIVAHGNRPAFALPLLAVACVGWVGWAASFHVPSRQLHAAFFVVLIGVAGGVLSIASSAGVGLLAAAAVASGTTFDLRRAVPLALCGPAALALASWAHNWSNDLVFGGAAAALGGLVGGMSRRQAEQRVQESARAELARELHDVLAHTLSALAVQLEAVEAVLETGDREKLTSLVQRSRRLVASGIDEAAGAVRALRDEPLPIADRLADLLAQDGIPLRVEGAPRALPPKAGLALYRATQEAVTNARKHAPGAATEVSLAFRTDATVVTVRNGVSTRRGAANGSGLGLQGMRERLELAGGSLAASPSENGFTVEATVPA